MAPPKKKRKCTPERVTSSASAAAVSPMLPELTDIETPNTESAAVSPVSPQPTDIETPNPASTATSSEKAAAGSSTPPRPPPPNSPAKCAICLGDLVNSCYTNSCMHKFCFPCLLQWSKVKPECPLCKSQFKSIHHNIRSNDDYDEYIVPGRTETLPSLPFHFGLPGVMFRPLNHVHSMFAPPPFPPARAYQDHGYSFRQFTSQTARDASISHWVLAMSRRVGPRARAGLDNPFYSHEAEYLETYSRGPTFRSRTSSPALGHARRKRIYDRGQRVRAFNASTIDMDTETFPSSVEYFRTHAGFFYPRVSEWLHRELTVLIAVNYNHSRSEMANIYERIFAIIFRVEIRSTEFREAIRPYLNDRSGHFQHEFYNFLLSGMSIEDYDRVAVYTSPRTGGPSPAAAAGESSTAVSHSDEPQIITIDEENEHQDEVREDSNPVRGESGSDRRSSRASVLQNQEIVPSDDDHELAHE